MELTARNATLDDLATLLWKQHASKLDVVAPATSIRAHGGKLVIAGTGDMTPHPTLGMVQGEGTFTPTETCDDGLSEKLGIHRAYLRRLRAERPDLFDANVNGWLHGHQVPTPHAIGEEWEMVAPADTRSFLVRCFKGDDGQTGIARAFLSNGYGVIDHIDVLTAGLEGIREAGVATEIVGCDLTERRMRVRVMAPEIQALAPILLAGYRRPFDENGRLPGAGGHMLGSAGHEYRENVVFAGFEISNSETGGGAAQIIPRLVVEICGNGLTITKDAMRAVHLGSRMDDGVIEWSEDTKRKELQVITAKARDAVATFLNVDYMTKVIAGIEEKAATPVADAAKTVEVVCKQLAFGEERAAAILDMFIRGGQMTAGGVLNAVTAAAQLVENADDAAEVEAAGIRALELAAAVR